VSTAYNGDHIDQRNSRAETIIGKNITVHSPLPPPPEWPLLAGVIPQTARHYQKRTITDDLHQALNSQPSVALRQTMPGNNSGHVVSGAGGAGKTQIAALYAHRVLSNSRTPVSILASGNGEKGHPPPTGEEIGAEKPKPGDSSSPHRETELGEGVVVDLLMWVTASTRAAIVSSYAYAARTVLRRVFETPEQAAAAFVEWLSTTTRRWLVVWDDLVLLQPPLSDGTPVIVDDLWPPTTPYGKLLITTRDNSHELANRTSTIFDLGVYTEKEANDFLTVSLTEARIPHTEEDRTALAELLGRLPLALGLTVAYIADRPGMTIAAYTHLFTQHSQSLERLFPRKAPGYQHTVAAAWSVSIEHANQQPPHGLAAPLAGIISLLGSDHIPFSLLAAPSTRTYLGTHITEGEGIPDPVKGVICRDHQKDKDDLPPSPLTPPASEGGASNILGHVRGGICEVAEQDVREALTLLSRLSLITLTGNLYETDPMVGMHQLTQRAIRESQSTRPTRQSVRATADGLLHTWPKVERHSEVGDHLRAHTRTLRTRIIRGRIVEGWLWLPDCHPVLYRAGNSLGEIGRLEEAIAYWEEMVHIGQHYLGPEHPSTLLLRTNLACMQGEAGNTSGAVVAYQQLLPEYIRVLGADHPRTLFLRGNLAYMRGEAGDVTGAVAAYEELLPNRLRVSGPDHPDSLTVQANLAYWRGESGDAIGAVTAYEQLLTSRLRVLGSGHRATLGTHSNIAYWRGRAGDIAGAVTTYEQLLPNYLRVLGSNHPDTLNLRASIAHWRGKAGNVTRAVADYEELVPDRLRVLGPDHPDTLNARSNLIYWRGKAGGADKAVRAYEELLPEYLRVLGPDHPSTLVTRARFAHIRDQAGDVAGAAIAYAELLTDRLRTLGPDHPDTLITYSNLAYMLGKVGDVAGAITAYQQLLPKYLRILGCDHPDTLVTRGRFAEMCGQAGDAVGAVTAYEELLADELRVLSPDHPDTLTTRANLAVWVYESGDTAKAVKLLTALISDQKRAFGPNHPSAQTSEPVLRRWQDELAEG
jgi:tetratricopeptide (TPR) repeat protein